MIELIKKSLNLSKSYQAYMDLFENLVEKKGTTGTNQSEAYIHYTKMNWSRTKRAEKRAVEDLVNKTLIDKISSPTYILTITEAWCGDASQIVPVVHGLTKDNPNLDMRVVLRDEHPELMDNFLTNGGKAIPIFIFIDKERYEVLGFWGARPDEAQDIVEDYKKLEVKPPYSVLSENLQRWYNQDKGQSTITEFSEAFLKAMKSSSNIGAPSS